MLKTLYTDPELNFRIANIRRRPQTPVDSTWCWHCQNTGTAAALSAKRSCHPSCRTPRIFRLFKSFDKNFPWPCLALRVPNDLGAHDVGRCLVLVLLQMSPRIL